MLTREWTKDYEAFLKEKHDLEDQKWEIDKKIRELEWKIKEEEWKMDENIRTRYVEMLTNAKQVEVIWWVYIKRTEEWIESVIFRNSNGCLIVFRPKEWELYEFNINKVRAYIIRNYEDALDNIKDESYNHDTFIRRMWIDDIENCWENCSLEDYMDNISIADVNDYDDLKEDVTEPDYDTLDKFQDLYEEEYEYLWYSPKENYFEKETEVVLFSGSEE